MRKKSFALAIICLLCILTAGVFFSGCSIKVGVPDRVSENFVDLAEGAKMERKRAVEGDSFTLHFDGKKKFNTVSLTEIGSSVTSFELYINGKMVYASDRIGKFKYCALSDTYEADELTVKAVKCEDGATWAIEKPKVYFVEKTANDDFAVMSYIYTAKALQLEEEDKKIIGCTTQFNIFSSLYLLADGTVYFKPHTLADGRTVEGEDAFRQAIANLRDFNPKAEIVATILGSEDIVGDGLDQEKRHNTAMTKNKDNFIKNILKVIDDYDLDGIAFDYEYPHNLITNNNYGNFLKKLKIAMPEGKQLNCAFSLWNLTVFGTFPRSKLKYVDHIELMAYDGFDEYGDHSSFYTMCAEVLAKLEDEGIDMSKVNLGLPFYSRPIDSAAYWGNYNDYCHLLGEYGNSLMQTINVDGQEYEQLCYYNSRQLVYDKTSYALDAGIGGVMIWHYGCDTKDESLSLYGAISQAIADRSR